jgi:multidrug efflux pump subunit AcrB
LPIAQAPGSNALELAQNIRATMEDLKKYLSNGLHVEAEGSAHATNP